MVSELQQWKGGGGGGRGCSQLQGWYWGMGHIWGDTPEERLLAPLPEVRLKMGVLSVFPLTSPKPLVVYANCPTPQLPQHPDFHPLATTPTAAKGSNLVASQSPGSGLLAASPSPAAHAGLTVLHDLFPMRHPVTSKRLCPTERPPESLGFVYLKSPTRPELGAASQEGRELLTQLAPPPGCGL